MDPIKRLAAASTVLACAIALASCATKPPPPLPQPEPFVYVQPSNPPPPDEWNLFPDPTTGEVDVYHKGDYVGAVTGNEPKDEDPPIPHPVAHGN
jgi:hypothetical protein